MTDTHDHGGHSHGHGDDGHSHGDHGHAHGGGEDHTYRDPHGHEVFKAYMVVAVALSIFTALSFIINGQVRAGHFSAQTGFTLILAVAIVKATLVGMYFMHLKFEWGKLYFMIVPAFILGLMMMFVLLPDIVFVWAQ
jgi:caa(3)-type oxidase subunit IV